MNQRKRCIAYIDGYNWYHAIFRHHPEWKWLNIHSFFQALRPREDVTQVKVFSAMSTDLEAFARQERYFKALKAHPRTQVILGLFQNRTVTCRAKCGETYNVPEEKKTDVNLAVEIISDAVADNCDQMCIATADSDIQPAVEWAVRNRPGIKVIVYIPALPVDQASRRTDYYRTKGLAVECDFMPLKGLMEHQFPGAVKLADGTFVCRPATWSRIDGPQQTVR